MVTLMGGIFVFKVHDYNWLYFGFILLVGFVRDEFLLFAN